MECGRMWRGLVDPTLLCPVLRFVFGSTALRGFLVNTEYSGILSAKRKVFMLAPRFVCVCPPCFPWECSASVCPAVETLWGTEERGAKNFVSAAFPLLCSAQLLHCSVCLEAAQNEMQQPGESTWEPFILLTCQTLGKDNDIQ